MLRADGWIRRCQLSGIEAVRPSQHDVALIVEELLESVPLVRVRIGEPELGHRIVGHCRSLGAQSLPGLRSANGR